jgi:hypothetical protein
MSRRNYTREIKAELRDGRIAVTTLGGFVRAVEHAPRSKSDPQPWTDGTFRYTGREVHTVHPCGKRMLSPVGWGTFVHCAKPTGHDKACSSVGSH